jgi:threonine/homoserine/homoserine lactone efflux protein
VNELAFLGAVAAVYLMLAVSPGPNFLVITLSAASESRRHAVCVGLGVSTASVLWASLAAAGLGVLIAQFAGLERLLRIAGGLYLVYLGLRLLSARSSPIRAGVQPPARSLWQAYRFGLATNLTNPKSLAFFSSAFAALFTPGLPAWVQLAAIGIVAAISISWNLLVVAVFSSANARTGYTRAKPWVDRISGALMAFFGFRLLSGR